MTNKVTREQIRVLGIEAAQHGDIAQRILCDIALTGKDSQYDEDCLDIDGYPDYSGGGHSESEEQAIRRALRTSQEDAIEECERVIEAGRG